MARMRHTVCQVIDGWDSDHYEALLDHAQTILIVDAPLALSLLKPQPGQQSVVITKKSMLTAEMISSVRPDAIIGPLISETWDVVDLGSELQDLGYAGDLFVLTRPLPRAELVVREVGAICTALRVRLLETA